MNEQAAPRTIYQRRCVPLCCFIGRFMAHSHVPHPLNPLLPSVNSHLTDRPDIHKVMKAFRHVRPSAAATSTSLDASVHSEGGEQASCVSSSASSIAPSEPELLLQQQQQQQGGRLIMPGLACFPLPGSSSPASSALAPPAHPASLAMDNIQPPLPPQQQPSQQPQQPLVPQQPHPPEQSPPSLPLLLLRGRDGDGKRVDTLMVPSPTRHSRAVMGDVAAAEAIFDLEASRRKRKLGQALAVDPTAAHLEQTLRTTVMGLAGEKGGESSGSGSDTAGGGGGGMGLVARNRSGGGGNPKLPIECLIGGGGEGNPVVPITLSSSSSLCSSVGALPPLTRREGEELPPPLPLGVRSAIVEASALETREDDAMLLLNLRRGGERGGQR